MSAPDTNTEREAKRHWPSLSGIAIALGAAAAIAVVTLLVIGMPAEEEPETRPVAPAEATDG